MSLHVLVGFAGVNVRVAKTAEVGDYQFVLRVVFRKMCCQVTYTSNLSADIRTTSVWAADVLWVNVDTVCGFAALGLNVVILGSPMVSGMPVFCQWPTGLEPFHAVYTGGHFGAHTGEEMDNKTQKFLLLPL